mmetsp:Transcript_68408/g.118883  ORF Transcript_68408/g.118883 Transcript_68408/m.118883 type:complete len:403 (+) Transcript_68408:23-1231(+)
MAAAGGGRAASPPLNAALPPPGFPLPPGINLNGQGLPGSPSMGPAAMGGNGGLPTGPAPNFPNLNMLPAGLMPNMLGAGLQEALPQGAEPDLKQEILQRISEQVKQLIVSAKRDAETKVKLNLKELHDSINDMDGRLDNLISQLDELEGPQKQALEQHVVAQALAKVEQQWGKELGKLKQELHQTIFAHNHNADLMKHQKDALDGLRTEIQASKTAPADRVKAAKAQLQKCETLLKGQQKTRRLEPLFQRLQALEQRIAAARWPPTGMMMPPPMAGMMPPQMPMTGMPPGFQAAAGAAATSGRANPKAGGGRNSKGVAPPGQMAAGPAVSSAAATGSEKKAPVDEEARVAKAAAKASEAKADAAGDEEADGEGGDAEDSAEEAGAEAAAVDAPVAAASEEAS